MLKSLASALVALPLFVVSCATPLPEPRPEVDAALEQLRSSAVSGVAPIPSELLEHAWMHTPEGTSHEVALLHTGTDALTARAHLIRAARETIDIQVFAWEPDEAGNFLLDLLGQAALRGVRVRLLVDLMANQGRSSLAQLCAFHTNLELRFYNPVGRQSKISTRQFLREVGVSFRRTNQRMHNKVMVVDGRALIVGGRNIGESYFDMDAEFNYLDRDALVLGPAADEALDSFDLYWNWSRTIDAVYLDDIAEELLAWSAGGPREAVQTPALPRYEWARTRSALYSAQDVIPNSHLHQVGRVDFLADPPGKKAAASKSEKAEARAADYAENRATDYVLMQSNYLVLSESRIRSLAKSAAEHPELHISFLTNSLAATANHMVYGVSRKQRTRILNLGLEVSELRPLPRDIRHFCPRYDELVAEGQAAGPEPSEYEDLLTLDERKGPQFAIHAKSVVIDGHFALVSSHNLDPRSDALNTEAGVLIWSEEVAAELESELRLMMSNPNSWRSALRPRILILSTLNDVLTAISRTLPVLDVWPVRDYGNYELREGASPVRSDAPGFHDHYRRVGEFPEVESMGKIWKTRMFSVFGGAIRGLL